MGLSECMWFMYKGMYSAAYRTFSVQKLLQELCWLLAADTINSQYPFYLFTRATIECPQSFSDENGNFGPVLHG